MMNPKNASPRPVVNPYAALITGVLAVSTGAIFARLADAPPLVIAAYRVGFAVLLLLPIAAWKARDEILSLASRDLWFSVLSGFFLACHFATWISSLEYTSVANSVVLVNTNPLWVAILTPLISKERIRTITWVGIIMSVAGAFFIGAGDFVAGGKALRGDLLAVSGGICAAVYLLLGRNLRRKLSLIAYITVCYGSAAVFLWLSVFMFRMPVAGFSTQTWTLFWAMAAITQLVGHTTYNWVLRWFSTSLVAVSLLGEPVGSTLLAYIILNEALTWPKVAGGVLILSAIYISALGEQET
jgi:drug/metabolite transporter (DMT)-like permease